VARERPDFQVEAMSYPTFASALLFLVLGVLAGLVGVAYNATLLQALSAADRLGRWPIEVRAGVIGAAVGVLAWFAPGLVGGGDLLTQQTLSGAASLALLPLVFLLRFVLGAVSYAAGTPGGLFAPMLVLGAQLGLLFGSAGHRFFDPQVPTTAFAVVGMAAFFTAVVRAPLTGIVLITEMTVSVTLLLPMLLACAMAMLVPTLLGNAPIYNSLRDRTIHAESRS
jgi:CIC family chloride channel protein